MTWEKVTVEKYQAIFQLSEIKDEMDRVIAAISILFDKSETEVNDMTVQEFNEYAKKCMFIFGDIPGKPVKTFKANGKKYAICYDVTKMRFRQYAEISHFGSDTVGNIHLIMASIVQPVNWIGKRKRNKAEDHLIISQDILKARFIDVFHAMVFFCSLFRSLIKSSKDYLVLKMMEELKMESYEAEMLLQDSMRDMDGFFQRIKSQHWNESV